MCHSVPFSMLIHVTFSMFPIFLLHVSCMSPPFVIRASFSVHLYVSLPMCHRCFHLHVSDMFLYPYTTYSLFHVAYKFPPACVIDVSFSVSYNVFFSMCHTFFLLSESYMFPSPCVIHIFLFMCRSVFFSMGHTCFLLQ